MLNKLLVFSALFLFLSQTALGSPAANERRVMLAMRTLHGAEMTYAATYGNSNFGTLAQLGAANLIHESLSSGFAYGYKFVVTISPRTQTTPAEFSITATPRKYRLYGVRSFFIDTSGLMRGADRGGQQATRNDPIIDDCLQEGWVIASLRALHGAEMTWAATYGNGNFGSVTELGEANLISGALATGRLHGYSFAVVTYARTTTEPALFRIIAIPQTYVTGRRSFYFGTEGVIYAADKNGKPADENDPPLEL